MFTTTTEFPLSEDRLHTAPYGSVRLLSVRISVYQITYVCRWMNNNLCVNVCHMVTDLKLHKSNYSCVCSQWMALSHYIDIKMLIRLCCWTVFLSLDKQPHACLAVYTWSSVTDSAFSIVSESWSQDGHHTSDVFDS